jgi:hypothetical protein
VPINVPPRAYTYARLSPDGTRVALDARDEQNDIWIWDLVRETMMPLTTGNNVAVSWMHAAVRFGFELRIACPDSLRPEQPVIDWVKREKGAVSIGSDAAQAARGGVFTVKAGLQPLAEALPVRRSRSHCAMRCSGVRRLQRTMMRVMATISSVCMTLTRARHHTGISHAKYLGKVSGFNNGMCRVHFFVSTKPVVTTSPAFKPDLISA